VRPEGFSAVMAHRVSDPDSLDYFPTPPWAARAGGELIRMLDPGAVTAWEPACGGGHMVHGLSDYFGTVRASDIHDYGAGEILDFLSAPLADEPGSSASVDWVVTNPPFVHGEAFVRAAWPRARRGVALLLRLQFREGAGRASGLFREIPLAVKATFAERVPMVKGRWDPEASSATAYAWFVWMKPEVLAASPWGAAIAAARPFGAALDVLIPPGSCARLTRRSDLIRFAACAPAPLFDPPTPEGDA